MIPPKLKRLVEQQPGHVIRSDRATAERALSELGVPFESEFAQFYLSYKVTLFRSDVSGEQLCDIAEPTAEVAAGTRFVREVWGLPEKYICFTSVQGEGAYLYDRESCQVWDFELASGEAFLAGKQKPTWNSFFDFMRWYLGG